MSKYANIWDSKAGQSKSADDNNPWSKIMQWLPSNQKVLDVGCSSGYFGEKLIKDTKATVWGLELDQADAAKAQQRGYKKVLIGDLDNFDWSELKPLKFDAIIFADVLEHIKDPLGCLKSAKTVLTKDGAIYCSIPNVANMTVRLELLEGNFDYESTGLLDNTHIKFFTKKTIYQTFAEAGLEITNLDATFNDFSVNQIKDHFKRLGLDPTEAFQKIIDSPESRTFQYIVKAKPSSKPVKLPKDYSLPVKLPDEWQAMVLKMRSDDKELQALRTQNQSLSDQLKVAEDRLAYIKKNPLKWAVKGAARRVSNGRNKH